MSFNFESFLLEHGIDYITSGKGVKKGNININCPFCNLPNTHHSSHHLGIDPITNYWGCWRNNDHRGRKPHKLIVKLLGCTFKDSYRIVGDSRHIASEGVLDKLVSGKLFHDDVEVSNRAATKIYWDSEHREFLGSKLAEKRFYSYLKKERGFGLDTSKMIKTYSLRYAISGDFNNRIIIPFTLHGRLVTWTGRAIYEHVLRYKNLSNELSSIPPKEFIYNYDRALMGGEVLFVVEGPFDTIKVDFYSIDGFRAVGLSNMTCDNSQLYWITRLSKKYKKVVIVLDYGEMAATGNLMDSLSHIKNISFESLPIGINDPGEMTKEQVWLLCEKFL